MEPVASTIEVEMELLEQAFLDASNQWVLDVQTGAVKTRSAAEAEGTLGERFRPVPTLSASDRGRVLDDPLELQDVVLDWLALQGVML